MRVAEINLFGLSLAPIAADVQATDETMTDSAIVAAVVDKFYKPLTLRTKVMELV